MISDFKKEYITGSKFKEVADFVIDLPSFSLPSGIFDRNGIIWCVTEFTLDLINVIKDSKRRYILISHLGDHVLSDLEINDTFCQFKPPCIVHVFARNAVCKRPDVTYLPIGITPNQRIVDAIDNLVETEKITDKICCAFRTYEDIDYDEIVKSLGGYHPPKEHIYPLPDRKNCTNALRGKNYVDFYDRMSPEEYIQTISSYLYIASPQGYGVDCFRTWEALYCGSIPIVLDSPICSDLRLPIIRINDWNEVKPENLSDIRQEFTNLEQLTMSYWLNLIHETKQRLL